VGLFVCLNSGVKRDDLLPQFGKIKEILLLKGKVFFLTSRAVTSHFEPHLHAFSVDPYSDSDIFDFVAVTCLADYGPMSLWTDTSTNGVYISMRHILL